MKFRQFTLATTSICCVDGVRCALKTLVDNGTLELTQESELVIVRVHRGHLKRRMFFVAEELITATCDSDAPGLVGIDDVVQYVMRDKDVETDAMERIYAPHAHISKHDSIR